MKYQDFMQKNVKFDIESTVWDNSLSIQGHPALWARLGFIRDTVYAIKAANFMRTAAEEFEKNGFFSSQIFAQASLNETLLCVQAGASIEVEGLEHLRGTNEKPVVYIGNHMSTIETLLLPLLLLPHNRVIFVIKESLLHAPFMGRILTMMPAIGVTRENPREDLKRILEEGKKHLDDKRSVVIFPQSTRSSTFDIPNFNTVGVKLARAAGVDVIPIALKTDFLHAGSVVKDFGKLYPSKTIHFAFGERIAVEGNGKAAHEKVVSFIREHMQTWDVPIVDEATAE